MANNTLTQLPFCHGMSEDEQRQLLEIAERLQFNKGEKVVTQGELKQNLWIVLEGLCQVTRRTDSGCQVNLADLGPGAHFGEMSFFHTAPNSADVIALSNMELLRIARADFDRLAFENSTVVLKLTQNSIEQMAERLRKMDQWITNLICGGEDKQPTASEWTSFRELIFCEK